jgi:hypothetical protein
MIDLSAQPVNEGLRAFVAGRDEAGWGHRPISANLRLDIGSFRGPRLSGGFQNWETPGMKGRQEWEPS